MSDSILCPRCGGQDIFFLGDKCLCGGCGHRFDAPAPQQAFVPMRLFLSGLRKDNVICQRIYKALKERGHEPWFDQSGTRTGTRWRTTLQEGVRSSQEVVACLSPRPADEPDGGLDELAIAVGVKGGSVHSILLGPEREVDPPATIGHEQWLDMSAWQEKLSAGPEVFDPWFHAKMQELFQVIESPENREFSGQIHTIRETLAVSYGTSRQNALLQKPFTGRAWLETALERWLDDPSGKRMCLLYGAPGVGKSAFAVHYTHYNSRVAACLFCQDNESRDPRAVIRTLAYLLACRLPEYRQSLLMHLPENKAELERLSEKELFARLLEEPLRLSVDGGHQTMVLVVDGLDECGSPEENALAGTLAAYADSLPAWLRILIVARATPAVTAYAAGAWKLEIAADAAANRADIRAYYEACLQAQFAEDPQWNASLEALTARSQGTFLYAEMMCSLLQERGTLSAAEEYPDGLDAMFAAWFQYFFPDRNDYCRNWRLPLSCLLGAKAPLPEAALRRVMGWSAGQLRDFCQRINVLLRRGTNTFGDNTLSIDHAYIRQWLQRDQPYAAPAEDGIEAQARAFYAHLEEDADSLSFYEAVQLPVLLQQAGMKKQCQVLARSKTWSNKVLEAEGLCQGWDKSEEAEEIYTDALNLIQYAGLDDDLDVKEVQSRFQMLLATRLDFTGQKGSVELFRKSIALQEQIVQERGTKEDKSRLAFGYQSVAGQHWNYCRREAALDLYQKSIALREQIVQENGTAEDKSFLADAYKSAARIHKELDYPDEALDLYQKSIALREQVVQERGREADKSFLADGCERAAEIYKEQDHPDEALVLYQKSIALREQVVQEHGKADDKTPRVFSRYDKGRLALSYYSIIKIYESQGSLEEMLNWYQKWCALLEQMLREHETPEIKDDLGSAYYNIAVIHQAQERPDDALEFYRKAYEVFEQQGNKWKLEVNCCTMIAKILREKGKQIPQQKKTFLKTVAERRKLRKESWQWVKQGIAIVHNLPDDQQTDEETSQYLQELLGH